MEKNPGVLIVVMPVYNSEKTLDAAISSVLNQSYTNLRLFIVDDCSTDSSLNIAKKYLVDPRVRILKNNKNMGAYYSRNVGLYYAKDLEWGYFTVHDSDDVSFNHRYFKIIKKLKASDRVLAAKDKTHRVDFYTKKFIRKQDNMAHAVFKKIIFEKIGYFENVRFGADWQYWERVVSWCNHSDFLTHDLDEVLGESYVHENNLTVLIPGRSKARRLYVQKSENNMKLMFRNKDWYMLFCPDRTKEVK